MDDINGNFTARFALYVLMNLDHSDLHSVANIQIGIALAYYHPEYAAAMMAELPQEMRDAGKRATDQLVERVPFYANS